MSISRGHRGAIALAALTARIIPPPRLPLTPGTRLGVYEVTAQIGAGGMGEVYKATDTNLKRAVAIKVLPASVAGDAERLARFQREAEVLAALNHPNIAAIYGLEKSDGITALVMELVEGPTLADRIAQGAIPIDEALPIAKQIAEALEAAHEQGIIHRDLKPANVKVRPDGMVKVLDFGLAKAVEPVTGSSPSISMSPTLTTPAMTQAGMILGTAAYMSPEQARGRSVDKRADIWAFGVVLYEMLTGRKAFDGEDVSIVLSAVIQSEPRWDGVPSRARRLLASCLEKDPRKRLRDIGDAWRLLDAEPEPASVKSRIAPVGWIAAGALAIVIAIASWAPWRASRSVAQPLIRLDVDLGSEISLPPAGINLTNPVISHDGMRLAYVASVAGRPSKLFTRRLDQPNASELPGTEGASGPFFSPDDQWIGFYGRDKLNRISVEGGAAIPIMDIPSVGGASWGEDGNIIVAFNRPTQGKARTPGLVRVPSVGGAPSTVTELADGELFHTFPQVLPGSDAALMVVYTSAPTVDDARIEIVSLRDGRRKLLLRGGVSARYLASGHLVYSNRRTLFAMPFDLKTRETRGTGVPVLDAIAIEPVSNLVQFDVSRTGTLVYRPGGLVPMTIQWLDASGKKESLGPKALDGYSARLSPDGKRVALVVGEGAGARVSVYDPQREAMTLLTPDGRRRSSPVWTPDGRYVLFDTVGSGIFWTRADGASQPQALIQSKNIQIPWSFSPDGSRLAYIEILRSPQLWTVPVEERGGQLTAGMPERFLQTQFADWSPVFSPDGRWLAYNSNESGADEVYVRAFTAPATGQGAKVQISNRGGINPVWSRSGRELLYLSGDQIMTSSYTVSGESFVAEKPRVWAANLGRPVTFDLAPDGKRAIVLAPAETPDNLRNDHLVVFLQNFFDELRRRVPVDK